MALAPLEPEAGVPVGAGPMALLQKLWQQAPLQGKLLAGGAVGFALVAIILSWGFGFWPLLPMVIGLTLVSLLLSVVVRTQSPQGEVLSWAVVALLIGAMVLLLSSAFFRWPDGGTKLLARWLDAPEIVVGKSSQEVTVDLAGNTLSWTEFQARFPQFFVAQQGGDRVAITSQLADLPPLRLVNGTLVLPPTGNFSIRARTLKLESAAIQLNGSTLKITALDIYSSNGRIFAFPADARAPAGAKGRNAGSLKFEIYRYIDGALPVVLRGEAGGNGNKGPTGPNGNVGPGGANAASGLFDCQRGPDGGGQGGQGQPGGIGSPGGQGGQGGNLSVVLPTGAAWPGPSPVVDGGVGGIGGPGGDGGQGGPGGPGGGPVGNCHGNGPQGPPGPNGAPGPTGPQGSNGPEGQFALTRLES